MDTHKAVTSLLNEFLWLEEHEVYWAVETEAKYEEGHLKKYGSGAAKRYSMAVETAHDRIGTWIRAWADYTRISTASPSSIASALTGYRPTLIWAVIRGSEADSLVMHDGYIQHTIHRVEPNKRTEFNFCPTCRDWFVPADRSGHAK